MDCSMLGFPVHPHSWSLLKLMSIESVMPPSHLILCCPLLLLLSICPSIRVCTNESVRASGGQSIRVSVSAPVLPMTIQDWFPSGWTGWISLQSKGLFKSLLQHHSSKASILWHSSFFMVQLSHPNVITRKTIAMTRRTFVDKVMSLLFNMLSRLVISFSSKEQAWSQYYRNKWRVCVQKIKFGKIYFERVIFTEYCIISYSFSNLYLIFEKVIQSHDIKIKSS